MPAGGDLLQGLCDCGTRPRRRDRRAPQHVHEVDHRDRCVRFGKRRGDGRECAWSETRAAELGRQHQPEQPGLPERVDSFGREPAFLVVLSGGRGQHAIGYFFGTRKRGLMIHDVPRSAQCRCGR